MRTHGGAHFWFKEIHNDAVIYKVANWGESFSLLYFINTIEERCKHVHLTHPIHSQLLLWGYGG